MQDNLSAKSGSAEMRMRSDIAVIRQHLARIDGLSRTWFEWSYADSQWVTTFAVELEFETAPNSPEFTQNVLNAIETTAIGVTEETTMAVSQLKVVTKTQR
jgi:hypothetical protein